MTSTRLATCNRPGRTPSPAPVPGLGLPLWLCLSAIVLSTACCVHRHVATEPPLPPPPLAPGERPLLKFLRGPCFGDCPVYELVLLEDGRLRYEGAFKVADAGSLEVRVTPAAMAKVRANIERLAGLSSDCCGCADWTDSSSVVMTFPIPGGTGAKTIDHYHGCEKAPDWLYEVENSIDEALETERWLGRKIEYKAFHPAR